MMESNRHRTRGRIKYSALHDLPHDHLKPRAQPCRIQLDELRPQFRYDHRGRLTRNGPLCPHYHLLAARKVGLLQGPQRPQSMLALPRGGLAPALFQVRDKGLNAPDEIVSRCGWSQRDAII